MFSTVPICKDLCNGRERLWIVDIWCIPSSDSYCKSAVNICCLAGGVPRTASSRVNGWLLERWRCRHRYNADCAGFNSRQSTSSQRHACRCHRCLWVPYLVTHARPHSDPQLAEVVATVWCLCNSDNLTVYRFICDVGICHWNYVIVSINLATVITVTIVHMESHSEEIIEN